MKVSNQDDLRDMLEDCENLRTIAGENIIKIQAENKKGFNKNRIKAQSYYINYLIAVKRAQFGPGLKLKPKFIGPYKVIKKLAHDRY